MVNRDRGKKVMNSQVILSSDAYGDYSSFFFFYKEREINPLSFRNGLVKTNDQT